MDREINFTKTRRSLLILATMLFFVHFLNAQNCTNFDRKCSVPDDKKYERSSMSRSIKIRAKQKQILSITLFEGKEYYISVCAKSNLGNIQLKILSGYDKKIMYDNAANGFVDFITIKSELTQKLFFEISAPVGKFDGNEAECLGLYIASCKIIDNKLSENK